MKIRAVLFSITCLTIMLTNIIGCKKESTNSAAATNKITDADGNVYQSVTIGTQVWMAENLKTTKYRNGDPIAYLADGAWVGISSGAYCWLYNDSTTYKSGYGALYNWHAVSDNRNLAPKGWHVATDAEWITLITFLAPSPANKLKEVGSTHWIYPIGPGNAAATNSTGFTAFPGGYRYDIGPFSTTTLIGFEGVWWTSTQFSSSDAIDRRMFSNDDIVRPYNTNKNFGSSVRCVKD